MDDRPKSTPRSGLIDSLKRLKPWGKTRSSIGPTNGFIPGSLFPKTPAPEVIDRRNQDADVIMSDPDTRAPEVMDRQNQDADVIMSDPDTRTTNESEETGRQNHISLPMKTITQENRQNPNDLSDEDIYDFNSPLVTSLTWDTKNVTASSRSRKDESEEGTLLPPSKSTDQINNRHNRKGDLLLGSVKKPSNDLLHSIKGMYRILDLFSEQGSGGLVDKVIIDQDSLRDLIDDLRPGACGTSLTNIDFKDLDNLLVKPLGVYGSKEEIVRLLASIGAVNDETAKALCLIDTDSSRPKLRSGLYIAHSSNHAVKEKQLYVVYWPEDTTWDDDAISSVRRNRVTFMRYLTKIADQVIAMISPDHAKAMISPDHAKAMIWNEESEDPSIPIDSEESDRLFTFEVAKTNEQEEDVTSRPGFVMSTPIISISKPPPDGSIQDASLTPRLLAGETVQAILTTRYIPSSIKTDHFATTVNFVQLRNKLSKSTIRISENINDDAIEKLIDCGLRDRFPQSCRIWKQSCQESARILDNECRNHDKELPERLRSDEAEIKETLSVIIACEIRKLYPILSMESLGITPTINESAHKDRFADLTSTYLQLGGDFENALRKAKLDRISSQKFKYLKDRIVTIDFLLKAHAKLADTDPTDADREHIVSSISQAKDLQSTIRNLYEFPLSESRSLVSSLFSIMVNWKSGGEVSIEEEAKRRTSSITDPQFLSSLDDFVLGEPLLQPLVAEVCQIAQSHFRVEVPRLSDKVIHRVQSIRETTLKDQIRQEARNKEEQCRKVARLKFIQEIETGSQVEASRSLVALDSFEVSKVRSYSPPTQQSYKAIGYEETRLDPTLEYSIHVLEMSEEDRHSLRLNPTFIPFPHVEERRSNSFQLPLDHIILHAQLLANNKCLLVAGDSQRNITVYCDAMSSLNGAICHEKYKKRLHRDKIGESFLLAFDETKRMLAVCESQKNLQLHIFIFDEMFTSLQALGSAVNLMQWYEEGKSLLHACFVSGSEEILLIDSGAQARIFSLITQQFRPASLNLNQVPSAIYSSPDGSCLFTLMTTDGSPSIRAYHWNTFGSTEGIPLQDVIQAGFPLALTSLVNRNIVHFISLDITSHRCQSISLDIKGKITEFMFKEKGAKETSNGNSTTIHNCLIDCHSDVWTRFPVVPAVRRQTITASSKRLQRSLTFVTDRDYDAFEPHFLNLIHSFEKNTRKPTGEELRDLLVRAVSFDTLLPTITDATWTVTCLRAGEWLIDLLCLIPIHLAITRENRFIPLKDGVFSPELERSLLGAEVTQIVDSLSFGWYESLFQSYMASKPVKVVSSMGEQSVGKSYTLNHLVDTSFAGSAMRTTEGVWMSVTPTADALIVALDFEGVHSIERSAQEDTLLVLFNTAISNLVLFRNNFALSRDITGLFQSFQSSSTVLDPAANPSLFQSTLMIIIKDVVDSDKKEITREFSLKFQKIVQEEQDANFISKLHGGKLDIIPWPVIESRQFYTLFPIVKNRLDQQKITHTAAGEFLLTLKTLMAKLKANDWGALSQTLAAHRAQRLMHLLTNALAFGLSEIEPEEELLKNLDTDEVIEKADTPSRFFLPGQTIEPSTAESALAALLNAWGTSHPRQLKSDDDWIKELGSHLDRLVEMRVEHVREWISCNLARFKTGHANMEALRRSFDSAIVDLKESVQLCKMRCGSCHLLCIQRRDHEGSHDCQTSHGCVHRCDFRNEHPEGLKPCGFSAGHPGNHICVVDAHLCGEPCKLKDRPGCLERCTKVAAHSGEDHMCPALTHGCGKPCGLTQIKLADGRVYSCNQTCTISSQQNHSRHTCGSRMCPISCQLCKRLCSNQDHLHGLDIGAVHLCGHEHSCAAFCTAKGICEIETAPQSIEATFTGRHETFQYTKYSQVSRRRQCVVPIPPGALDHSEDHSHSSEKTPFHFCETRCSSCGYFCTLPIGHSQQEHETSHGSMSKTRWVVDGPNNTLEVQGRKFASNDEGAPMMCNLVCHSMGRHVHIDYCRAPKAAACTGPEIEHIRARLAPNPDRPKDSITHNLHWRRSGFKDPYSREDQTNFAKCDIMCGGPEHLATTSAPAQPSYCTLPLFHAPQPLGGSPAGGMGYVSNDGHSYSCRNPAVLQQAFHVIFVVDRSGSMGWEDRRPLPNTPVTAQIIQQCNNRLGAVYSALYGFWTSRNAAMAASQTNAARRDAYSVILFDHAVTSCLVNDFASPPATLLNAVLTHQARGGTNYTTALETTQEVMRQHWSTERSPVVIFLSDGECTVADQTVQNLCRAAVTLGKPLSFHTVSFGPQGSSHSLRRMAQIALEVQNNAPRDPLLPAAAIVLSSYTEALDTVQLAETFLGIADSLRKPRGSLLR